FGVGAGVGVGAGIGFFVTITLTCGAFNCLLRAFTSSAVTSFSVSPWTRSGLSAKETSILPSGFTVALKLNCSAPATLVSIMSPGMIGIGGGGGFGGLYCSAMAGVIKFSVGSFS